MKILFIGKSSKPVSGWGRISFLLLKEFRDRGYNVKDLNEDNKLLPLSKWNIIKNILTTRREAKNCDIVHALDGWPYGIYGYFAIIFSKKKFFINGVGTYSVVPFNNFLKGIILKIVYRRANRIFCISKYTEKRILEKVKLNNTEIVYLGGTSSLGLCVGGKFELDKDRFPKLLTVGGVKDRKGQFFTLKAVELLKNKYPNVIYYIVGPFDDLAYVEMMKKYVLDNNLSENVKFLGHIKDDNILFNLYRESDIFLLCSISTKDYFEGFGLVLIEAASFGKPVIGSLNNGTEDAVRDGCNGYLVEQKNHKDIYEKMLLILEGDVDNMSKCSEEWAKGFSWDKTVDKYISFYKE